LEEESGFFSPLPDFNEKFDATIQYAYISSNKMVVELRRDIYFKI
jgi:hypothetical protein